MAPSNRHSVNGRSYAEPTNPTVVVCVDGFDPAYLASGIAGGTLPNMSRYWQKGYGGTALASLPTFTNPNNMSIVTGAPPNIHGISGNYYLDRETGEEVMVTDASLVRSETILGVLSRAGVATAVVTAKDKLRKALGHKMEGICFSVECVDVCTKAEHGIENVEALVGRPKPDRYSADLSLFVLDAGIRLLEQKRADLLYLSLSDFVQHKYAPGTPESDAFHSSVDEKIGRLAELGATVAITADHGMKDKSLPDGSPNVIYLEDELERQFGGGSARVICPITDPFVRHHGALGSFVRVYARDTGSIPAMMDHIQSLPGVDLVLERSEACERYDLPEDREGDIVVTSDSNTAIGSRVDEHDLSGLGGERLRTHGGLFEQEVPFLTSHPLTSEYRAVADDRALRNYDIFDFALNGVQRG